MVIAERQSFSTELLQQGFDLDILEVNDLLLTLVHETTDGGQQDVPGLEKEGHGYRPKQPVSKAGEGNQPAEMAESSEPLLKIPSRSQNPFGITQCLHPSEKICGSR